MKRKLIFITLVYLNTTYIYSQSIERQLVSNGGASIKNADISVDFSIGESIISTEEIENSILTQGFQQPNLRINTAINEEEVLTISVFPNPSSDNIKITTEGGEINLVIYDDYGHIFYQIKSSKQHNKVNITNWPSGKYHIVAQNRETNNSQSFIKI